MIDYIVLMSLMKRREKLYTLQRSFCHRLYYANRPFLCISSTYEFRLTPFALSAFRIRVSSFRLCACVRFLQSPLLTDTHTRNNGRGSRLTKDDATQCVLSVWFIFNPLRFWVYDNIIMILLHTWLLNSKHLQLHITHLLYYD